MTNSQNKRKGWVKVTLAEKKAAEGHKGFSSAALVLIKL